MFFIMAKEYAVIKLDKLYEDINKSYFQYRKSKTEKTKMKYRKIIDDNHDKCIVIAYRAGITPDMHKGLKESNKLWKKIMGLD